MEDGKSKSVIEKIVKNTWPSILSLALGFLTSVMASVATLADMKARQPLVLGIFAGFVGLLVVAQVTTTYLRRGPSRIAVLKSRLRDAYLGSLDTSRINPTRAGRE